MILRRTVAISLVGLQVIAAPAFAVARGVTEAKQRDGLLQLVEAIDSGRFSEGCCADEAQVREAAARWATARVITRGEVEPGRFVTELEVQGERWVCEMLSPAASRRHLNRSTHSQFLAAKARAEAGLRQRGLSRAREGDLSVRYYRKGGTRRMTQSQSGSEGAIHVSSWNDGNSGTWEGTLTVENYNSGGWGVFNQQIDITAAEIDNDGMPRTLWSDTIGTGGGGPIEVGHQAPGLGAGNVRAVAAPANLGAGLASLSGECSWGAFWFCAVIGWLIDIGECAFSGPLFWACIFLRTGYTAVICMIGACAF